MDIGGRRVLICDCEASMPLDGGKLTRACHAAGATGDLTLHTQLCRAQLANFQDALADGTRLLVACTQEAPLFGEIATEGMAEDADAPDIAYTNIRERAGWADQAGAATPKIAALIAEAALDIAPTPSVALASQGVCLIYGPGAPALDAARQLAGRLDASALVTDVEDVLPPAVMDVPIF
ncbi:MAG: 4Fe-4S ferredoxin, partial [Kiloniellaceae bacterium]